MRNDLPAGVAAAQIVHAAGESSPGNLPEGTFAVVLGVSNESVLYDLAERLQRADIKHVTIVEVDAPYTDQMMAIGLVPAPRSVGRRVLSSLPLYRGPVSAGDPARDGSKPAPAPFGGVAQSQSART